MKLIIQAHKLQRVLSTARDIVAKNTDSTSVLAHHMLLRLSPENNMITALSGDKEMNHYTQIPLEEEKGERIELSSNLRFISIVAARLSDLLTGVEKESLITISAPTLSSDVNSFQTAEVLFDKIRATIECSNGHGYVILRDKSDEFQTINLHLEEGVMRELVSSVLGAVNPKSTTAPGMIFTLSKSSISALGLDNSRIYTSEYIPSPDCYSFSHEDLIYDDEHKGNHEITFTIPRKGAVELARICDSSSDKIKLQIHVTMAGVVRLCEISKGDISILFSATNTKAPAIRSAFPDTRLEHIVVDVADLKHQIMRASKFDEIISLQADKTGEGLDGSSNGNLKVFSSVSSNFDSFEATIPAKVDHDYSIRLNCKHVNDILNTFLEFKNPEDERIDLALGGHATSRANVAVFEEMKKTRINRRCLLLAYGAISNRDS